MEGQILYPLISFGMIFDTDVGIVRFAIKILKEHYDYDASSMGDSWILSHTLARKRENPLSVLPDIENIDEFYNSIITDHVEEYTQMSPFTDYGRSVMASHLFDGVLPYILVYNQFQKDKIIRCKIAKPDNVILTNSIDLKENSTFKSQLDPYYLYSYKELYTNITNDDFYTKTLIGKNIYLNWNYLNQNYLKDNKNGRKFIHASNALILESIWRGNSSQ